MLKKKILIVGAIIIMLLILIDASQSGEKSAVSEYNLYEPTYYTTYGKGSVMQGVLKTTNGDNLQVNALDSNGQKIVGYNDDKSYIINARNISDKFNSLMYFPKANTIYTFGKNKPINILIISTMTESDDPYNSPLYIGYHDGTCEYPEEIDYVRSKDKCNQYLRDTLDFVGYGSVDEMLEDVFGDYITKDTDKREVSN